MVRPKSSPLRLGLLNENLAERFGVSPILCSYIFTTWIKLLSKVVGCMASEGIHKRTFTWNFPPVWLWKMLCNHRLCRGIYWNTNQTTNAITHLNFWLELHPLGLFRSSIFVMGVEQVTNLSPEIVSFMIY